MNATKDGPRASTREREQEINVLIGRISARAQMDPAIAVGIVIELLTSAASLAEEPYDREYLSVRQARADRALSRLRRAAGVES